MNLVSLTYICRLANMPWHFMSDSHPVQLPASMQVYMQTILRKNWWLKKWKFQIECSSSACYGGKYCSPSSVGRSVLQSYLIPLPCHHQLLGWIWWSFHSHIPSGSPVLRFSGLQVSAHGADSFADPLRLSNRFWEEALVQRVWKVSYCVTKLLGQRPLQIAYLIWILLLCKTLAWES